MKIRTHNNIAQAGLQILNAQNYTVGTNVTQAQAILLRSYKLQANDIPATVAAIARAGAGVNNIPLEYCNNQGIVVMNTPGANANSVKELVLASLILLSRPLLAAHRWCSDNVHQEDLENLVESNKKHFIGGEIRGKTLGIIGLGAVGVKLANAAINLGMKVIGFDPYISISSAWRLNHAVEKTESLAGLYACDYLSLHTPLSTETRKLINKKFLAEVKTGLKLVNLARAELIDEEAVSAALASGQLSGFANDFPSAELLRHPQVIALPHLGASTHEAEENCAVAAAQQLLNFLENGSIKNSVNFSSCSLIRKSGDNRFTLITRNVPNMIGQTSTILAQAGINIQEMFNQHHNDIAYNIIGIDRPLNAAISEQIAKIEGVLRLRVLPELQERQS